MKNYLYIILFIGLGFSCKSQRVLEKNSQIEIVHLPQYYREDGAIFSKDYPVGIEMKNFQYRYTPSIEDITKAEAILSSGYSEIPDNKIDSFSVLKRWVRQYVGLIDTSGNKNIIVQLINNTKPRKIKNLLGKGWKQSFVIMLSDSFYEVSTRFRINIDRGSISTEL